MTRLTRKPAAQIYLDADIIELLDRVAAAKYLSRAKTIVQMILDSPEMVAMTAARRKERDKAERAQEAEDRKRIERHELQIKVGNSLQIALAQARNSLKMWTDRAAYFPGDAITLARGMPPALWPRYVSTLHLFDQCTANNHPAAETHRMALFNMPGEIHPARKKAIQSIREIERKLEKLPTASTVTLKRWGELY